MRGLFLFLLLASLLTGFYAHGQPDSLSVTRGQALLSLEKHPMLQELKTLDALKVKPRMGENRTIPFFISLLFLFFLALMRQVFPRHLEGLIGLLALFPSTRQKPKAILPDGRASLGFHVLYACTLAYVLFEGGGLYLPGLLPDGWLGYVAALAFVALLFLGGRFASGLVAWVFGQLDRERDYRQQTGPVNEFTGMALFPLCVLMFLGGHGMRSAVWGICLVLLGIALLVKVLRNVRLAGQLWRADFIHFLLYLCAFEIVPAGIMVKWATTVTG